MVANLNLNLIRVFNALMLEKSVTRAADRLHIKQNAVSMALAKLRVAVGDPLFVRVGHGVAPTPVALSLADDFRIAIEDIDRALARIEVFDPAVARMTFTILAPDDVRALFLPRLLARLRAAAPGVTLKILPPNSRRIAETLEEGGVDFGIGYIRDKPGSLRASLVLKDRFVWLSSARGAAYPEMLALDDLASAEYVDVGPVGRGLFAELIDEGFISRGLKRSVVLHETSFLLLPHLLGAAGCLAAAPYRLARLLAEQDPGMRMHDSPIALPPLETHLYWHARSHALRSHRWMRELVQEVGRQISASE